MTSRVARYIERCRAVAAQPSEEGVAELLAEDAAIHLPSLPGPLRGRTMLAAQLGFVLAAVPDLRVEIRSHAAGGDVVFVELHATGTSPWQRPSEVDLIVWLTLDADGLARELHLSVDTASIQLGP